MATGGLQGAVLNAAKEVALDAFIEGRIGFLDMAAITEEVMDRMSGLPAAASMDDVFAADGEARERASALVLKSAAA